MAIPSRQSMEFLKLHGIPRVRQPVEQVKNLPEQKNKSKYNITVKWTELDTKG